MKSRTKSGSRGRPAIDFKIVLQMVEMRAKGKKIAEIAAYFGVSHGSVSYYVRTTKKPKTYTPKQAEAARLLRQSGFTYREIVSLTGLNIKTVREICGDIVVPGHYAGHKLPDDVIASIKTLRSEGVPLWTIVAQVGVGWGTVVKYVQDVDVPVRNRGHRISPETVEKIITMNAEGRLILEITAELGITKKTVLKYLREHEAVVEVGQGNSLGACGDSV